MLVGARDTSGVVSATGRSVERAGSRLAVGAELPVAGHPLYCDRGVGERRTVERTVDGGPRSEGGVVGGCRVRDDDAIVEQARTDGIREGEGAGKGHPGETAEGEGDGEDRHNLGFT